MRLRTVAFWFVVLAVIAVLAFYFGLFVGHLLDGAR